MAPRVPPPSSWTSAIVAYALLGLVICFFRLDVGGLMLTEGMVAEAGRNVAEAGDWIVPRMYGEPYTYKPPLAYWVAAAPIAVAGGRPTEAMLRLPFAASGWLMGLAVVALVGRLAGPRTGLLAGLAAIGSGLFIQKGQAASFDVLLAAGLGVAVAAACVNLAGERARGPVWLVAYLGLSVAFLTKGGIALMIFVPGLLAAALASGRLRRLTRLDHLAAAGLFALVAVGYLALLARALGEAGFEQPLAEAQRRALDWSVYALGRTVAKPVLIWAALLPWSVLLPHALLLAVGGPATDTKVRLLRVSLAFLIAGVVAFVLVPTHEMRYYLPLCTPAGIAAGTAVAMLSGRGEPSSLVRVVLLILLLVATAAGFLGVSGTGERGALDRALLMSAALAAAATAIVVVPRDGQRIAVLLLATSLVFLVVETSHLRPRRAVKRSLDGLARMLEPLIPAGETVWVRGPADYSGKHGSLFFYLDRPVRAFRTGSGLPPVGGYYVFASDLQAEGSQTDIAFEVIETIEHPRYTYHLARITESSVSTGFPPSPPMGGEERRRPE